MKKYFILILFIIGICRTYSQIPIVDAETNESIPFVEIYTLNGDIIGITNIGGLLDRELLSLIKEKDSISFNHLSYKENLLAVEDVLNFREIRLTPEKNLLQEVTLIGKRKKIKTFLKLKGYYRNYQTNDNEVKYFTDGIVEYYIPLNNKNKIWNRRIQERSFVNKKLEKEEKKRLKTVVMTIAGPPRPDKRFTKSFLEKEHYTFAHENKETQSISLNGIKKGIVGKNPDNKTTSLQIQLISKDQPKEYKLFGYHSVIENHLGFSVYNTTSPDSLNNKKLIYHKEIRKLRFKHKKDKEYQYIEGYHEFFITEAEILSEFKKSFYSKWFGFNRNSDYVTEYWKDFEQHPFYKPLPTGVEWALKNKLTELENTQEISKIYLDMGLIKEK